MAKVIFFVVLCGFFPSDHHTSASMMSEDISTLLLAKISPLEEKVEALEDWKKGSASDCEKLDGRLTSTEEVVEGEREKSIVLNSQVARVGNETIEERVEHLEEVCKTKLTRTCEELRNYGVKRDGTQWPKIQIKQGNK